MSGDDWTAVHIIGADRPAPLVVACEHGSRHIPKDLGNLGLDPAALASHAVWDIGAAHVARALGETMQAPVVEGGISRLVYDCNRPPSAPDAIPAKSEVFDIPGNRDLGEAARDERFRRVHEPYHAALAETCRQQEARSGGPVVLITVHSFTPVYLGQQREVEIGFLHDATPTLARAALGAERARGIWRAALNSPYSAADGVTHTLARHAEAEGRDSVMIEIRNDLIADDEAGARMAAHLAETLRAALAPGARQGAAE
ncbi:Predicted N-formylglutamate amidohydrolase [Palleronia marisminoris]|uniref:N-formylglutamate amidohydrolase n=1 Tax=Palleronia marisminoris TaxID=315423 RepID=A0A1Y5TJK7_9RHOB|nr:N-formylglutamate amidohydrolase [Palleronia marisminoris]SFH42349.1 Predicted N-formylglutamate amidohydrolase [Palleronia marisminoris]SLN65515.1 N-formylglutamate amidohydrolase [Palleronia marisminoris]